LGLWCKKDLECQKPTIKDHETDESTFMNDSHPPADAIPPPQPQSAQSELPHHPHLDPNADIDDSLVEVGAGAGAGVPHVSLSELFVTFAMLGSTTFGGMWAASQKLEEVLVIRKGWLTDEIQQTLMIAATVIPSPKFLSFGGLVGYRLRGWRGSVVAVLALVLPGSAMVLAGAALLNPATVGAALVPISRAVEIGVIGLLFGNAYHQITSAKVDRRNMIMGVTLTLAILGASIAGVPMLAAAMAGLFLGSLVLRGSGRNKRGGNTMNAKDAK
jgi:chromate transporter